MFFIVKSPTIKPADFANEIVATDCCNHHTDDSNNPCHSNQSSDSEDNHCGTCHLVCSSHGSTSSVDNRTENYILKNVIIESHETLDTYRPLFAQNVLLQIWQPPKIQSIA